MARRVSGVNVASGGDHVVPKAGWCIRDGLRKSNATVESEVFTCATPPAEAAIITRQCFASQHRMTIRKHARRAQWVVAYSILPIVGFTPEQQWLHPRQSLTRRRVLEAKMKAACEYGRFVRGSLQPRPLQKQVNRSEGSGVSEVRVNLRRA